MINSKKKYLQALRKVFETLNKLRPKSFTVGTLHTFQLPHSFRPHDLVMQTIFKLKLKSVNKGKPRNLYDDQEIDIGSQVNQLTSDTPEGFILNCGSVTLNNKCCKTNTKTL